MSTNDVRGPLGSDPEHGHISHISKDDLCMDSGDRGLSKKVDDDYEKTSYVINKYIKKDRYYNPVNTSSNNKYYSGADDRIFNADDMK